MHHSKPALGMPKPRGPMPAKEIVKVNTSNTMRAKAKDTNSPVEGLAIRHVLKRTRSMEVVKRREGDWMGEGYNEIVVRRGA